MTTPAGVQLLKQRINTLEEAVEIIDRGVVRSEEELRDKLACAFSASGTPPNLIYAAADQALLARNDPTPNTIFE